MKLVLAMCFACVANCASALTLTYSLQLNLTSVSFLELWYVDSDGEAALCYYCNPYNFVPFVPPSSTTFQIDVDPATEIINGSTLYTGGTANPFTGDLHAAYYRAPADTWSYSLAGGTGSYSGFAEEGNTAIKFFDPYCAPSIPVGGACEFYGISYNFEVLSYTVSGLLPDPNPSGLPGGVLIPTPVPPSLPLMAGGVAFAAFIGRRRAA